MPRFQVYRVRVTRPVQQDLLRAEVSPSHILNTAIRERPSKKVREPSVWHIGNVQQLDEHGLLFALGRTGLAREELFDEGRKDFVLEEFEKAPFTYCLVDTRLQACAIMPRSEVASDEILPVRLAGLLNETVIRRASGVVFSVEDIQDPKGFIEQIREAERVIRIEFTFRRPNFFDVEEDIQNPLQKASKELEADGGTVAFEGENLERDPIEKIAHAVAATADDLSAKVVFEAGASPERRTLAGNPLTFQVEEIDTESGKQTALKELREQYARVRSE